MRKHFQRLRREERGMSLVLVGMGFMGFMAATTLAIDVGMFMTARSQAQNSADAGALAGAVALVFNDWDDRSENGPAVQSSINTAVSNIVMGGDVSVGADDVTFPLSPSGLNNRVRVVVRRNGERENPIPTLIGPLFGVPTVDIMAVATAEASPANAATCAMPFTIPDRWIEKQTGEWDPDDDFNMYANKNGGTMLANPDVYIPPGTTGTTGYNAERDKGMQITLKNNNTNKTAPSFYNPFRLGASDGADDYRESIGGCNTHVVKIGDLIDPEPGNMVGPTKQGMEDLILKDPDAYWNESCNCVKNSRYGVSPRTTIIPLYDPIYYETGKQNGSNASLKVANLLGFFIEEMDGNEVVGRITPVTAMVSGNSSPAGAFAYAIRLVE